MRRMSPRMITEPALALNFVKSLPQQERYTAQVEALQSRAQRVQQRRKEEKAHKRNVKQGKK